MLSTIIIFFIVFGILVFVHELGHFLAAKYFGVGVEEFGFGYPPKIFGIKKGKTVYSLNLLPLGGFCKIKGIVGGDQDNTADSNSKDSFEQKKIWQRAVILGSGVLMNFLLCVLLFSVGYLFGMPENTETLGYGAIVSARQVGIAYVEPNTPAARAGLLPGDLISSVDGMRFGEIDKLQAYEQGLGAQEITLEVRRQDELFTKKILLEKIAPSNTIGMGVYLAETGTVRYPWYLAPWQGIKKTFNFTLYILQALYYLLKDLIIAGKVSNDISGPVGIAVMTNQVSKMGFIYILQFTALLSINLGIFNILPLPALDGGRILFLIIEKFRGKPVSQKIESLIHNLGFAALILLVILVTFKDLGRYNIFEYIRKLF